MNICHLVYECVPGNFAGGVQKMVWELARAQGRLGDEVEIWTIGKAGMTPAGERVLIRSFPGSAQLRPYALHRALEAHAERFSVIHAHNTFLALNRTAAALARQGARVFYHAHGALDPVLLSGRNLQALKKRLYISAVERRNYDTAQGVIGLTAEECRQLTLTGTRAAIFEVGNGIDLQTPAPAAAAVGFRLHHRIAPGLPVILFVGRIVHKKGLHHLLDALPAISGARPGVELVICGGRNEAPEYVAALDRQIARLQLKSRVHWTGYLNEEGKKAAYAASSLFVHPSYSEGMAMAVLEAMSFGVPTVVTPGCYLDQAVAAGAVRLAEQSSRSLAETIISLLESKEEASRLAARGREYVIARHAWPDIAARLRGIYSGNPVPAPYRRRIHS